MPSISIIVPVFNGIRYLPHFLQSLSEAVPPNAELIFVDDGSSEPVLEILPTEFPVATIKVLRNDYNRGYSFAVNRGLASASGDILVQLNTDLVLDRNCIHAMVEVIDKRPDAGVVGSKQLSPTTGLLSHIGMAFGNYSIKAVYSGLPALHPLCCKTRKMQIVHGATVAMTRKIFEEIGPLDERYYNSLENLDHCMKAYMRGYSNYTCSESIVYHWASQSGPARFARAEEGDAIFWSDWASFRTIDLGSFVEEAIDHIFAVEPKFVHYNLEPLNLCRGSDESILMECLARRWRGIESRVHRTRAFNSPQKKLWLPMELPYRALLNPAPYVYLVDRVSYLSENRMWFESRHRIVESEIIIDSKGVALTSQQLLALYGES